MKTIILLLLVTTITSSTNAQNMWKDYIVGRPMMGYVEAKEATAKEWGLHYKIEMAGCIVSDETEKKMQEYDAQNVAYFKELETTFGKDWQKYFNLDVRKKMFIADTVTYKGVWRDPVIGKPYIQYFEAKTAVAQKWGIHYEPNFMGCEVGEEVSAKAQKIADESDEYLRRITANFGDEWNKDFEKEIQLEMAKQNAPIVPFADKPMANKASWSECVIGKPDQSYFDAKQAVANEWGIAYKPYFMGCKRTKALVKQKSAIEKTNNVYLSSLAKRYGEDWEVLFKMAVEKRRNLDRMKNS